MSQPDPAFHIPLKDKELKLVGEIAAIHGQIEYLLGHCVCFMTGISNDAMLAVMHSASLKINAHIFVEVARTKVATQGLRDLAENIFARMEALSKGRNDFIHAIYASDAVGPSFMLFIGPADQIPTPEGNPSIGEAVAVKTGSYRKRSVSDLRAIRDEAAKISCALAHFERCAMTGQDVIAPTPWRGKY